MSTLDLSKDSKRKPAELVSDVALSDEAVALLDDAENTYAYLGALADDDLFNDAFLTLARTLPKQYAIVWASKCVEESLGSKMTDDEKRCFDLTNRWLNGPTEELRRAAMDMADEFEYEGPGAWLVAAVGFSGGSLGPPNQAEVPPANHLTAVAVSVCLLSLAAKDPETLADNCRQMLDKGIAMVAIPGSGDSETRQ